MSVEVDGTLTTGSIREIILKRASGAAPKSPLIVQILQTQIIKKDNDISYQMFVSDGDLGITFRNDVKFNRLHSTGQLCVFTIIKIMKYEYVLFETSSSCHSVVSSFEILANGRDIKRIIGKPSNLPTEMRDWLNLYAIRLEKEILIEKEVAKWELKCLNSSTNISKLSTGSLQKICYGTKIEYPIFQILSMIKITNAEENFVFYSIDISDGQTSFHRVESQSCYFNNLAAAGFIKRFSIIRLDRYKLAESDTRIQITHVTVINKDVESQIGENLVPAKLRIFDYRQRDKQLNDLKIPNNKKITLVDPACLVDILKGVPFSQPVVQIIKFHINGPELSLYNFEISDGRFKIFTEFFDKPLLNGLLRLKNVHKAIVRINDYQLSFVRETNEQYKPILHIIKLTFLTDPNKFDCKDLLGEPTYTDVSIPVFPKDCKNLQEQSSVSTETKNLLEKSLFKKGFLCKPPTKKVQPPPKKQTIPSSNKVENELEVKVRALTLQLKELEENKAIAIENDKLQKKLENKKKNFSIKAQKLIENNLEIIGVEQKPNEDLKEIVNRIFTFVSISLNIDVDVTVKRSGPEIVIKCKNTATKKIILDGMRGKELHSGELCLNIMKRKIFINEQLTPLNKLIYVKAKALRDDGVFNIVWIKNGKVLAKIKSHGNKPIHICSMDQMREYCTE